MGWYANNLLLLQSILIGYKLCVLFSWLAHSYDFVKIDWQGVKLSCFTCVNGPIATDDSKFMNHYFMYHTEMKSL